MSLRDAKSQIISASCVLLRAFLLYLTVIFVERRLTARTFVNIRRFTGLGNQIRSNKISSNQHKILDIIDIFTVMHYTYTNCG